MPIIFVSCRSNKVVLYSLTNNYKLKLVRNVNDSLIKKCKIDRKFNTQYIIKAPENIIVSEKEFLLVFNRALKKRHPIKYFFKHKIKYKMDSTIVDNNNSLASKYILVFNGFTFYQPLPNGRKFVFRYFANEKCFIFNEGIYGDKF